MYVHVKHVCMSKSSVCVCVFVSMCVYLNPSLCAFELFDLSHLYNKHANVNSANLTFSETRKILHRVFQLTSLQSRTNRYTNVMRLKRNVHTMILQPCFIFKYYYTSTQHNCAATHMPLEIINTKLYQANNVYDNTSSQACEKFSFYLQKDYRLMFIALSAHKANRFVGLVVRRPPWERKIPGSNPACAGIFSGSSHTSDFKIGTPMATLPSAGGYRVSTGTGQPGVSILWLGEVERLICNFYLSVAARKIVQIRPWDTLVCCWDVKHPTNKQIIKQYL